MAGSACSQLTRRLFGKAVLAGDGIPQRGGLLLGLGGGAAGRVALGGAGGVPRATAPADLALALAGLVGPGRVVLVGLGRRLPRLGEGTGQPVVLGQRAQVETV